MAASPRARVARPPKPARRAAGSAGPLGNGAGNATRELLITTGERLIAEQGLSISNRQIGEAAGQANNSVVGYHFGTKQDLVLAILRRHAPDMEQRRLTMLSEQRRTADLKVWLSCVVKPLTDHLESLGTTSWYARFLAQVTTDPVFRQLAMVEFLATPSMQSAAAGLTRALPVLPQPIFDERSDMTRYVVVHTCAERERALHSSAPTPRSSWSDAADGIVDALIGLWRAPPRGAGPSRS